MPRLAVIVVAEKLTDMIESSLAEASYLSTLV